MRSRYKSPAGTGIVEIDDGATVEVLFQALRAQTLIENFTIKYGPPTGMQTISLEHRELAAANLGLHGQTLTIVPGESKADISNIRRPPAFEFKHAEATLSNSNHFDDPIVPWPQREGSLCKFKETPCTYFHLYTV